MNGRSLIGRSNNSAISSRHLSHLRNHVKSGLTIWLEGIDMPLVWMKRLFAAAQPCCKTTESSHLQLLDKVPDNEFAL